MPCVFSSLILCTLASSARGARPPALLPTFPLKGRRALPAAWRTAPPARPLHTSSPAERPWQQVPRHRSPLPSPQQQHWAAPWASTPGQTCLLLGGAQVSAVPLDGSRQGPAPLAMVSRIWLRLQPAGRPAGGRLVSCPCGTPPVTCPARTHRPPSQLRHTQCHRPAELHQKWALPLHC